MVVGHWLVLLWTLGEGTKGSPVFMPEFSCFQDCTN